MKKIISALCVLILLAGCSKEEIVTGESPVPGLKSEPVWTEFTPTTSILVNQGNVAFSYNSISWNLTFGQSAHGKQQYTMTGGTSYKVEFDIRVVGMGGGGSFYTPSGAPATTTSWVHYSYTFTSGDCYIEGGGGSFPAGVELRNLHFYRAIAVTTPPDAPGNATVSRPASFNLQVNWTDNSNNESGFKIYRKANDETQYTYLGLAVGNATSYTDASGLSIFKKYSYKVTAYNQIGESAASETQLIRPTGNVGREMTAADFTTISASPGTTLTVTNGTLTITCASQPISFGNYSAIMDSELHYDISFNYNYEYQYSTTGPTGYYMPDGECGVRFQTTGSAPKVVVNNNIEYYTQEFNNWFPGPENGTQNLLVLRAGIHPITGNQPTIYVNKGASFSCQNAPSFWLSLGNSNGNGSYSPKLILDKLFWNIKSE